MRLSSVWCCGSLSRMAKIADMIKAMEESGPRDRSGRDPRGAVLADAGDVVRIAKDLIRQANEAGDYLRPRDRNRMVQNIDEIMFAAERLVKSLKRWQE